MVLDLRCIRARRFARARPRPGPRGASNLGISSLVPGIGSYWYVSTEIATGARAYGKFRGDIPIGSKNSMT
eukprot:COSAG02_NODE_1749_length_11069_cov_88.967274_6_plen_71_part_00